MSKCPACNMVLTSDNYCFRCGTAWSTDVSSLTVTSDPVNHPSHYTSHPSGVECITVTRHMNYNKGSAMAYIWRAGAKDDEIQDLSKAIWHLSDEIERIENERKGRETT